MENVKEYVVFHATKWDDICDKKGQTIIPRTNNYYLEGFWGLDDCKDWVSEGNKKGSKTGAIRLEDVFAVCKEKLIPLDNFEPYPGETMIVCVKTKENTHKWKEVLTMEAAKDFVQTFDNVSEIFACSVFDIELID